MKALKTIGKVVLAIIGCVLMPILIWVALGAAVYQKARAHKVETVPTFGQILTAGIKK